MRWSIMTAPSELSITLCQGTPPIELKSYSREELLRLLTEKHNEEADGADAMFSRFKETHVYKDDAEAAVSQAVALQEVFTAMAETRTAAALKETADQRYEYVRLKMQLAKAVNDGLISRETLTKIRGLS